MKKLMSIGMCIVAFCFLAFTVSAIPDTEIYNFRASATAVFLFDEYNPSYDGIHDTLREIDLYVFFNESQYYYVLIRGVSADVSPYDDFFVSFSCDGEPATSFHTTDYTSWVESGQISFKKQFNPAIVTVDYGNATIDALYSYCQIYSANSLVVDGNSGYTQFNVDLVPVTTSAVTTLERYCEEAALQDTITAELSAINTIFTNNVNFITTLFTVFQILALIFVVLGIPIMVLLLVRWVIWKVTGMRILERKVE